MESVFERINRKCQQAHKEIANRKPTTTHKKSKIQYEDYPPRLGYKVASHSTVYMSN